MLFFELFLSLGLTLADLRHSYAVAAIQSGHYIKTVQENLGHHTAAFTLDVYGHVTEEMKRDSANCMEAFNPERHQSAREKIRENFADGHDKTAQTQCLSGLSL